MTPFVLLGTDEPNPSSGKDPCGKAGDPVDIATGYFIHEQTDLVIPGIFPVKIKRYYRNRDGGSLAGLGAFGKGTWFEYDWWLGDYTNMVRLVKPGNYKYDFPKQPDGTYKNSTDPEFRGAVITYDAANDTHTLRTRDGSTYKFDYKDRESS